MATLGDIETFKPETESIATYLERVEMFLVANQVHASRKVAVSLTLVGAKAYSILHDLTSPNSLAEKSFDEIIKGSL